jgi:hypothetical protein
MVYFNQVTQIIEYDKHILTPILSFKSFLIKDTKETCGLSMIPVRRISNGLEWDINNRLIKSTKIIPSGLVRVSKKR